MVEAIIIEGLSWIGIGIFFLLFFIIMAIKEKQKEKRRVGTLCGINGKREPFYLSRKSSKELHKLKRS